VARGWLNPKLSVTNDIFMQMIEDILALRSRPGEATRDATGRLSAVY